MGKAKVYFIKKINSENLINILEKLPNKLVGNVAIKVHSGEEGNQNFLHPEFYCDLVKYLHGTIVETNTAYEGSRNTTIKHKKLLEKHNWNKYFQVDLLDEFGDLELKIPDGKIIRNEETRALLDSVQEDFGRRTELSPDELIDVMIDVEDDMDSDFSD